LERLRAVVKETGMIVFALVDHSGEAAKAGLAMPDTKLLIFGSPAGGTPIMLAAPLAAWTCRRKCWSGRTPPAADGPHL
jgi:uncharacterized protein (DUF302 family)